jgi:hypothetical protein
MEVLVSAVAFLIAVGCFLAVVANDLGENDRLLTLRNAAWLSPTDSRGNSASPNDWQY